MEEEKKLKVLFMGDMVAETGFSTVNHNIIKYIKDDFEITGLGVNYNGDPHGFDFPIFPAMTNPKGNIYGIDRACALLSTNDYDVVFILNDAWVISYYLEAFKQYVKKKLPKIVVYFPVDAMYHDPLWYKDFDIVAKAFTYTEFGKQVINECKPELEVGIIPHGVDTSSFYKMYETRHEARHRLFGDKLKDFGEKEGMFMVLNANRNQPRKKLDITFRGFSIFAKGKPKNVKLYMHTGVVDSSVDIRKEAIRYDVDDRLIFTSMNPGIQKSSVEKLNLIYNACDVGINTSLGEGWGLTNIEHSVTGAVQIVPRHSACTELYSDCGLLMEIVSDWTFDNIETVSKLTSAEELARCLEVLYRDRKLMNELSIKGRKKFIDKKYEWKTIAETWKQVFEEVCKQDVATVSE